MGPPAPVAAPPPAAAPVAAPPAAAPAGGGMMSGMMGAMATGMATGVGMSVANRAVDSMLGPRQTEVVHRHEGAPAAPVAGKCQAQQDQLSQCMQTNCMMTIQLPGYRALLMRGCQSCRQKNNFG